MRALLKLTETPEDLLRLVANCETRGVEIVHRKYGIIFPHQDFDANILDSFSGNLSVDQTADFKIILIASLKFAIQMLNCSDLKINSKIAPSFLKTPHRSEREY